MPCIPRHCPTVLVPALAPLTGGPHRRRDPWGRRQRLDHAAWRCAVAGGHGLCGPPHRRRPQDRPHFLRCCRVSGGCCGGTPGQLLKVARGCTGVLLACPSWQAGCHTSWLPHSGVLAADPAALELTALCGWRLSVTVSGIGDGLAGYSIREIAKQEESPCKEPKEQMVRSSSVLEAAGSIGPVQPLKERHGAGNTQGSCAAAGGCRGPLGASQTPRRLSAGIGCAAGHGLASLLQQHAIPPGEPSLPVGLQQPCGA